MFGFVDFGVLCFDYCVLGLGGGLNLLTVAIEV